MDNSTTNKTNLAKSGTGTWVLNGSTSYTGTTAVSAGTLVVNGSIASPSTLTISSGARLAGSGSIASPITVTGTLAPGYPFGVMTTTNTMSFGAASRLTWELGGNAMASADSLSTGAFPPVTNGARIDVTLNAAGSTVNFLHSFGDGPQHPCGECDIGHRQLHARHDQHGCWRTCGGHLWQLFPATHRHGREPALDSYRGISGD